MLATREPCCDLPAGTAMADALATRLRSGSEPATGGRGLKGSDYSSVSAASSWILAPNDCSAR